MLGSIVWDVDPVLVHLGSLEIRWYGLMWGLGFILAYELMSRLFKREKYPDDWADKLFVYCIVSSVIGARLGHCLFYEWDYYGAHPVEILKIWKGGLASHGGVFALILALVWYSKKITRKSVWWLFDRMIPAVAVVCMCIRFGNLMNSEIFGYPTALPWGFEFVRSREWQELYNRDGAAQACHPTQIYEMLYCLAALVASWVMYHKYHLQKRVGLITGVSLLIFFGARFGLEFMKNPQVAEEVDMTLNIGQWLSLPLILLGVYLIATCKTRKEGFMKKIFLFFCMCLCVPAVQAQDMKSLFIAMPDSLSPLLTKVNREDFGDFLASGMKAEVKNRFGKPSEMTKLTDGYLQLNLSGVSRTEMKLLPLNDSVKVICVVHTYMAPVADSRITFYDTHWRQLPTDRFLTLPEEDGFYRTGLSEVQADSLRNLRMRTDMYMLKAELSDKDCVLRFVYTTPDYLDEETRRGLKPYLHEAPLCAEWKGGRFVEMEKDFTVLKK